MADLDAALEAELIRRTQHSVAGDRRPEDTRVVVLAGGRGRRLEPYTSILPKPLMPIGNRSILEIVVAQLADAGFRHLTFSVGYLSHLIRAVFESGTSDGRVQIDYVTESEPLGTAAPLRLVDGLDSTFLAMNGDLLTTLDYAALLDAHRSAGNVVTIATHRREIHIDYGVLHLDGSAGRTQRVVAYEEKPKMAWDVSMGIYVLEPAAIDMLPASGPFDFPDLVRSLLEEGMPVGAFEHDGLWLDIGRHSDYERAVDLWQDGALAKSRNGNGSGHLNGTHAPVLEPVAPK